MYKQIISKEEFEKLADKKHLEFKNSLILEDVDDPFTATILGSVLLAQIVGAAGVAVVAAAAGYGISALMRPSPQMQQVGLMKGTVQMQNSVKGYFIPEIYGAAPSVSLTAGTTASWSNVFNASTGGGGLISKSGGTNHRYDSSATAGVVTSAQDAFIEFVPNVGASQAVAVGFSTDTDPRPSSFTVNPGPPFSFALNPPEFEFGLEITSANIGTDSLGNIIYSHTFKQILQGVSGRDLGSWTPGDTFRLEKRDGAYHIYHNLGEVGAFTPPVPSATVYIAVAIWATGGGLSSATVKIGGNIGLRPSSGSGGCKVPGMVAYAINPQKHSTIVQQHNQGGKGHQSTPVEQVYYTMDWRMNFGRGPLDLIREYANTDIILNLDPQLPSEPSGLYDPTAAGAVKYDPNNPPTALFSDDTVLINNKAILIDDPDDPTPGGGTGTTQNGGSIVAVYIGSETQLTDPTEEADIDAKYGVGSTSAHRGVAGIVHTGLNLNRWSNLPPNIVAVWQHQTLKTLGPIYQSLCLRIIDEDGDPILTTGDMDFSSLDDIIVRGMLIDGRQFTPAEIIDNPEVQDVYNYFTTEGDGKILGFENGDEPSVTIQESDIGWIDGAEEVPNLFVPFAVSYADETKLVRKVTLKYINAGDDWDPDTASSERKVTKGNENESLQVALTLNPEEGRTATDRRLMRSYIEGTTVSFTLNWKYMYLFAGYMIIVPMASSGITYTLRLTARTGGIGVNNCEAKCIEVAAFNPALVDRRGPIFKPSQPLPPPTILSFMDLPPWRPQDVGKFGAYVSGTPRNTDLHAWKGYTVYIRRANQSIKLAGPFNAAATMGVIASVSDLYPVAGVTTLEFTTNFTTGVFTSFGHQLVANQAVKLRNTGGALPSSLNSATTYYVRDIVGNTFKLSLTAGGSAVVLSNNGTGIHQLTTGEITVDLYGSDAGLSSVALADMLAGSNLAVAGNCEIAFADATRVSGYPNRWTLSTLNLGIQDTDISTIVAGRNFVILNDAVSFVELEDEDKDQTLFIKAVSLGTSPADSAELEVTITGNSTKPTNPDTFEGIYYQDNENILLQWAPGEIAPVKNSEEYEIEIMAGAGTGAAIKRGPVPIAPLQLSRVSNSPPLERDAVFLGNLPAGRFTAINPSGYDMLYQTGDSNTYTARIKSSTKILPDGGFMVEGEVAPDLGTHPRMFPDFFGVIPTDGSGIDFGWTAENLGFHTSGIPTSTLLSPEGVFGVDTTFPVLPGDRPSLVASPDGTVSYYLNYLGAASQPLYVSPNKIDFTGETYTIAIRRFADSTSNLNPVTYGIRNVRWLRQSPEFLYTEEMQLADFASVIPATIYARVRQKSLNKSGKPSDWVYGIFVR